MKIISKIFLKKNSGFSLIETLIGLGVLGIVITGTVGFLGNNASSTKRERYRGARDQLAYLITEALNNPENIALSARKGGVINQALVNCLGNMQEATGSCNAIGIDNAKSFSLFAADGTEGGKLVASKTNSGRSVFYGWDLTQGSDPGKFKLYPSVYFWAGCSINPKTMQVNKSCNKASTIFMSFVIQPVDGPYSPNWSGAKARPLYFYPYPKNIVSANGSVDKKKLYSNIFSMPAPEVSARMPGICPLGRYMKGYDAAGKPICECFTAGCVADTCTGDQIIIGYDEKGKGICRSLTNPNDFKCFDFVAKQNNQRDAIQCPTNHWLVNVSGEGCKGGASFNKQAKGGWVANVKWEIQCDKSQEYQCCRFKGVGNENEF